MVAHRLQGRTFKASSGQLSNFKIRCLDFSSFGLLRRAFIIVNCRQKGSKGGGQAFCYLHYLLLYSIVHTCIRTYIHTYIHTYTACHVGVPRLCLGAMLRWMMGCYVGVPWLRMSGCHTVRDTMFLAQRLLYGGAI